MALIGNNISMSGDWERLRAVPEIRERRSCRQLNLLNAAGNGDVTFSHDGSTVIGILVAGQGFQFLNVTPEEVWIKGTATQVLYWVACE
jgi:hypothetical protein